MSGSCGNATIFAKCSGMSINNQAIPESKDIPTPNTVMAATIAIAVWLAVKNSMIPMTVSAPPANPEIAKMILAILIARPPSVGLVRGASASNTKGVLRIVLSLALRDAYAARRPSGYIRFLLREVVRCHVRCRWLLLYSPANFIRKDDFPK